MKTKVCTECKQPFDTKRYDAITCSTACRKRRARRLKAAHTARTKRTYHQEVTHAIVQETPPSSFFSKEVQYRMSRIEETIGRLNEVLPDKQQAYLSEESEKLTHALIREIMEFGIAVFIDELEEECHIKIHQLPEGGIRYEKNVTGKSILPQH